MLSDRTPAVNESLIGLNDKYSNETVRSVPAAPLRGSV